MLPVLIAIDGNFLEYIAMFQTQSEIIPGGPWLPAFQLGAVNQYPDLWLFYALQCGIKQRCDGLIILMGEFTNCL